MGHELVLSVKTSAIDAVTLTAGEIETSDCQSLEKFKETSLNVSIVCGMLVPSKNTVNHVTYKETAN